MSDPNAYREESLRELNKKWAKLMRGLSEVKLLVEAMRVEAEANKDNACEILETCK